MKYTQPIAILILAIVLGVGFYSQDVSLGGGRGETATSCAVNTVAAVSVGDDISTSVLSAHSQRAWARIAVNSAEVEPIFVSFDEGAAATANNGIMLTATGTPEIVFGRNTDFVYTGAVTAITGTASTTVSVTECRY